MDIEKELKDIKVAQYIHSAFIGIITGLLVIILTKV